MDYEKLIVRRTIELAGENTGAQLQFLLQRLEAHPDALDAIMLAVEDMRRWNEQQVEALRAEKARREARDRLSEITKPQK